MMVCRTIAEARRDKYAVSEWLKLRFLPLNHKFWGRRFNQSRICDSHWTKVKALSSSLPMMFMQRTVPRVRQVRCILGKCGESDFNARIGVLRLELSGNNQGHDSQTCAIEDRFIMDTITVELPTAKSYAAPGHLGRTSEIGFVQNARGENLNIETIPSNPFLPTDRKWAIRFNADGTVTIVLGMRNYGRGWYSSYFAGLVRARLGVPFQRVRIYYSATLP